MQMKKNVKLIKQLVDCQKQQPVGLEDVFVSKTNEERVHLR